jgi:thiol:disulfide interchange protein
MAEISWLKDVDAALNQARATGKPVLLDFTAAPM